MGFEFLAGCLLAPHVAIQVLQPDGSLIVLKDLSHLLQRAQQRSVAAVSVHDIETIHLATVYQAAVSQQGRRVCVRQLRQATITPQAEYAAGGGCQQTARCAGQFPAGMINARHCLQTMTGLAVEAIVRTNIYRALILTH